MVLIRHAISACGVRRPVGVMSGVSLSLSVGLLCSAASGEITILGASHDNTLYEAEDGNLSNGAGEYLFAGTTNQSKVRRGLMSFDFSAIPQGATITSVSLRLFSSMGQPLEANVSLHRALGAWGEGASDAQNNEGSGADAELGDATWLHSFYNNQFWQNIGGDFSADVSATTTIGLNADFYHWSGTGMTADVQAWVAGTVTNNGWFLLGQEPGFGTAKRFSSRENATISQRPQLTVEWVVPAPGTVAVMALAACIGRRRRRIEG
ncbi:MAG: DNRLRE domain-containing protein [Phycisphaerae bacterium]|nr:DNRLRE domain-containing protein [Phycisphaerae bacterium]